MGRGVAKIQRICRLRTRARETREAEGKSVVKWYSRYVVWDRGMPMTLKRTRACAHILGGLELAMYS